MIFISIPTLRWISKTKVWQRAHFLTARQQRSRGQSDERRPRSLREEKKGARLMTPIIQSNFFPVAITKKKHLRPSWKLEVGERNELLVSSILFSRRDQGG